MTETQKPMKPGEAILALLADGKEHGFPEIHQHIVEVLGDKDRDEKATRVALQLLKDTGRVGASSVTYSLVSKGV